MKIIDAVANGYLNRTMNLYDAAFPEDEKKDWQMMLDKRREGILTVAAAVSDAGDFLGEAIWFEKNGILLIDYLAVAPEFRGTGIGSQILKLIADSHKESRIVLEIESTFAESQNAAQRISRKNFYLRAGMLPMPYRVDLFDVEMEILTSGGELSFDEYRGFLGSVWGENFSDHVAIVE